MQASLKIRHARGLVAGEDVTIIGDLDSIDVALTRAATRRTAQARELKTTEARIRLWQQRRQRILQELGEMG